MSATLAAEQFSTYFFDAKVLYVSGRLHPVDVFFTEAPEPDYLGTDT
jgi:HrpA-like RNA helicase